MKTSIQRRNNRGNLISNNNTNINKKIILTENPGEFLTEFIFKNLKLRIIGGIEGKVCGSGYPELRNPDTRKFSVRLLVPILHTRKFPRNRQLYIEGKSTFQHKKLFSIWL